MKKIASIILALFGILPVVAQVNTGTITFKAEGMQVAQPYFQKGLLLLHSFEYADAAEQFQMAQLLDPDFVMAYWGDALCYYHPVWGVLDYRKGRAALLKMGVSEESRAAKPKNEVEKGFLEAVEALYEEDKTNNERKQAYSDRMKELYTKHPDEAEVASFYALSLLGLAYDSRDLKQMDEAAAACQKALTKIPDHPGALHYVLHAYDDPSRAFKGLEAAEKYLKIAQGEHALHIPSHIFAAMGLWDKVVQANELSWEAAEKRVQKKKLSLEDRGYHSLWWLVYGYLQQGKHQKAAQLVQDMYRDARVSNSARSKHYLVAMKAAYLAETNNWSHSIAKIEIPTHDLNIVSKTTDQFLGGLAAYHKNDASRLSWVIGQLNDQRTMESNQMGKASASSPYSRPTTENDLRLVEAMEFELRALLAVLQNELDNAVLHAEKATQLEESSSLRVGPPALVKPAYELYGEILLTLNQPQKAPEKFDKALMRSPNRSLAVLGKYRAYKALDDKANMAKTKQLLLQNWKEADATVSAGL